MKNSDICTDFLQLVLKKKKKKVASDAFVSLFSLVWFGLKKEQKVFISNC